MVPNQLMHQARILKLTSNLQHIVINFSVEKLKRLLINADKSFDELSESPNCIFFNWSSAVNVEIISHSRILHTFIHMELLTARTRTYLDIVMVELLAVNKSLWLDKLVGVYQLTYMCSMDSVTEVNRETVVMVEAFQSAFIKARDLQSC